MEIPSLEPHEAALIVRLAGIAEQGSDWLDPLFDPNYAGVLFAGRNDPGKEPITPQAVQRLGRLDLVEITDSRDRLGRFRLTKLGWETSAAAATSAGASYHERLLRGEGSAVDLSWEGVGPIAEGIYRLFGERGAARATPGLAGEAVRAALAPASTESEFAAQLRALKDRDWITYRDLIGPTVPDGIAPTSRSVAYFGGWPDGGNDEAITSRLLALLDEKIDKTTDVDERSKLVRLRGAVGDVSKSVVAGLLLEVGKGAL